MQATQDIGRNAAALQRGGRPAAEEAIIDVNRVRAGTKLGFLGPAVFALAAIGLAPLIFAIWTSLYNYNLTKLANMRFIGLGNYAAVFTDPVFWQAMGRTFTMLVIALPVQIALGMGIALLLHQPGLGFLKTLARLSLVIPMATTYAVVGLLGQVMFNLKYGVVNQLLGFIGIDAVNWLGVPAYAFATIIFWDIWQWTPFCALVFLAGLTTVPMEIEEAARLETKSWWTVLRHIQLPFLVPGLTAVLILRTADTLKQFDMVFTMTRGGPGSSTELISLLIQRIGFRAFDQGLASAQAVVLLVITIVLSRLYIRIFYREV
ncbi:carbohydrate ABC transporter permease [Chelativorans intermedius]|uniref:Carbohydrate ABC transporter permease n=1 Tax=Chelativorans intermedius TaxID=515947 RepID=A0ABV6D6B7_9HYPH|nr:sugar ABC transporter permease [Chelativorans intermedius]MCT8999429.1 sugar ABC transporter permease [Chelativorans intermedius]